jgi:hypothetical protein
MYKSVHKSSIISAAAPHTDGFMHYMFAKQQNGGGHRSSYGIKPVMIA